MTIHTILEAPDPALKQVSTRVETFDGELKTLVDDMLETMYDANGIGLAAVQIGVAKRILVIDLQPEDEAAEAEDCGDNSCGHDHKPVRKEPQLFINPEILDPAEEQGVYQEGCLSVPDIYADIERPKTCRTRWQDLDGNVHEEEMDGLMAICIQHEMDHLNGILFIDHLSNLKRKMVLKKLAKARRAA